MKQKMTKIKNADHKLTDSGTDSLIELYFEDGIPKIVTLTQKDKN